MRRPGRGPGPLSCGVLALALVGLGVLGGCSSGGSKSAASSSTTRAVTVSTACELLTAADASAFFGKAARVQTPSAGVTSAAPPTAGIASQCVYEPVESTDGQLLQFRIFDGEQYSSKGLYPNAPTVAGLGAKSYATVGAGGLLDLQFVHDGRVYALAYSNLAHDTAAKTAQLETLAKQISARR